MLVAAVLAGAVVDAAALDWTSTASRTVSAAGDGCGSSVTETVRARRGAFDLRALTAVGTTATDDVTDEVVARVTAATPVADAGGGIPGVAFTLTGSDDVCANPEEYPDGWSTGQELSISYVRREPVFFHEFYDSTNHLSRQRPRWIHGGSDFGWTRIRWSSWGGETASGHGVEYWVKKDRVPYKTLRFPERFTLGNPQRCHGQWRYLHWEIVRTTRRPRVFAPHRQSIDLTCDGGIYA